MTAQGTRDPVFKGATRPAMLFGIPIVAFVLVAGSHLLVGMWLLIFANAFWFFVAMSAAAVELLALRMLSKHDAQRVSQALLWLSSYGARRNKVTWGAHSMSPIVYRRRRP